MAGKSIAEVLKGIAVQAGIPKDSAFFYLVDSDTSLKDALVSDSILAEFKTDGLMTVEAARNNPDIFKHFKGKFLNDVDREIEKNIEALGFSKEEVDALLADKDSFKKLGSLFKGVSSKITDLSSKGDGKMTDDEKRKYIEKINGIPALLTAKDVEWQKKVDEISGKLSESENTFENERIENAINENLSKFNFSDSLPREDYVKLIKDKLTGKDFVIKRKEGALTLVNKENPELEYLRNNKKTAFTTILEEIAAPYLSKANRQDPANPKKVETSEIKKTPAANTVGTFGASKIFKAAEEAKARQAAANK